MNWIFKIGLIFVLFAAKTTGYLNIFLNLHEVIKLLGVSAELYYVRDGLVNDYALNFVVPVPAHMQEISFSWQSLTRKQLPYSINIATSDLEVLPRPTLNISQIGEIPTKEQTFAIGMKCSGIRAAEVDITITIEIILNKATNNITELIIKRRKICLATIPEPVDVAPEQEIDDPTTPEETILTPRSEITALLIGGVLALVLISILISIAFCGKGSAKPQNNSGQLVKTSSFQHLQGPPGYALKSIYSSPTDALMMNNTLNGHMTNGSNHHHHHHHDQNSSSMFTESIHYSSGTLGGYLRPPLRLPISGHYNQCSEFGDSYYMSIDERI